LLDERNLRHKRDVMTLAKRNGGKSTILFISLSTSSSFSGLDAITEERGKEVGGKILGPGIREITARCAREPLMETSYFQIIIWILRNAQPIQMANKSST
jgi:hypothetical protein